MKNIAVKIPDPRMHLPMPACATAASAGPDQLQAGFDIGDECDSSARGAGALGSTGKD